MLRIPCSQFHEYLNAVFPSIQGHIHHLHTLAFERSHFQTETVRRALPLQQWLPWSHLSWSLASFMGLWPCHRELASAMRQSCHLRSNSSRPKQHSRLELKPVRSSRLLTGRASTHRPFGAYAFLISCICPYHSPLVSYGSRYIPA